LSFILFFLKNAVKRDRIGNRNTPDGSFFGLISDSFAQAGGSEASTDSVEDK